MPSRTILLTEPFLHLPIRDSDRLWYVKLSCGGQAFAEYGIGLTGETPDFYCPLCLDEHLGQTVTLSCDDENAPDTLFDGVIPGGRIEDALRLYPDLYRERTRQQVHFSSRRGWLNDPNGLVYANGEFRMCYQHNPFSPNHNCVSACWGLAVSKDGVHFTEYPDPIMTHDAYTTAGSGSAIVDADNLSGFGSDTILAVFTRLAAVMKNGRTPHPADGQYLYYSTDGGYRFRPIRQGPVIPDPTGTGWRDPKILRVAPGKLCIAVYETFEGRDCVSFYSSGNCLDWKFESRTENLYECPDLFPLPVAETGETLWALYGGNGEYRIGTFEKYRFTAIGAPGQLDYGTATYAGQTWNSHPDPTARYHIAWLHDEDQPWFYDPERKPGMPFAQSMTVLCRFTLHRADDGYRLFRTPIEAFSSLRRAETVCRMQENTPLALPVPGDAELTIPEGQTAAVTVNGQGFRFDGETFTFTGGKTYRRVGTGELTVRIVTDVRSVEFFLGGEISASYFDGAAEKRLLSDVPAVCRVWKLESIWA